MIILDLVKKDIISFVGAGGKTTMMFKLAEELRLNNKVLVTTTTKIYVPLKRHMTLSVLIKKSYLSYCYEGKWNLYCRNRCE